MFINRGCQNLDLYKSRNPYYQEQWYVLVQNNAIEWCNSDDLPMIVWSMEAIFVLYPRHDSHRSSHAQSLQLQLRSLSATQDERSVPKALCPRLVLLRVRAFCRALGRSGQPVIRIGAHIQSTVVCVRMREMVVWLPGRLHVCGQLGQRLQLEEQDQLLPSRVKVPSAQSNLLQRSTVLRNGII